MRTTSVRFIFNSVLLGGLERNEDKNTIKSGRGNVLRNNFLLAGVAYTI